MPERTIVDRLMEALRDLGRPDTEPEIARICDIKQPSVNGWKKPGKGPALDNAYLLANELGICIEWIYTGRGPKHPGPPDALAQELWSYWPRLTEEQKHRLIGRAEDMAESPSPEADNPDAA